MKLPNNLSVSHPILLIAAELSAPPSSPIIFRDLSLYASIFGHYEVLAHAPEAAIDYYNTWFKRYGLWDFIADLITDEELEKLNLKVSIEVESGVGAKLTAHNLGAVIGLL